MTRPPHRCDCGRVTTNYGPVCDACLSPRDRREMHRVYGFFAWQNLPRQSGASLAEAAEAAEWAARRWRERSTP